MVDMIDHPFFGALHLDMTGADSDMRQICAYAFVDSNDNIDCEIENMKTKYPVVFEQEVATPLYVADNTNDNRYEFLRFMIDLELRARRIKEYFEKALKQFS